MKMTRMVGPLGLSVLIFAALVGLAVCLTGGKNQRLVLRG